MAPVRSEVAEALRLLGPASVAEIAQVLDRPADTLYRHVAALKKVGFVRDAGLRKTGRNAEQLFELTADDFAADFSRCTRAAQGRALHGAASGMLKAMDRTLRDAAAAELLDGRAATRNVSLNFELGWLTPEGYAEVRSLIGRMKQIMDDGKRARNGRLYMTLAMATPVARKRGARKAPNPAPAP